MDATEVDIRKYFDLGHQGDYDVTQIDHFQRMSPAERLACHRRWGGFIRGRRMSPEILDAVAARLTEAGVEFLVVGGVCATLHGSPRITLDLDLCYRRTPENIRKIVSALGPLKPRLRDFPPGLPFFFDEHTLQLGSSFTFLLGDDPFDLLAEMSGVGGYDDVIGRAVPMTLPNGLTVTVMSLADLIATKEAAGRPKDKMALLDLYAIRDAQARAEPVRTDE